MPFLVCDSSFLILVSKLEMINLLTQLFDKIEIPKAVFDEAVEVGKILKKIDAYRIEKFIKDKQIRVENIKNIEERNKIMGDFNIHEGEAEAIILYLEKNAHFLATDDYRALKTCKVLDIKYFTTLLFIHRCFLQNITTKNKTLRKLNNLQTLGWYKREDLEYFKNKIKN
jgi:predicted nucleic acid-binding protein